MDVQAAKELTNTAFVPTASLAGRWLELCSRYLPVNPQNSFWRFSRQSRSSDPEQGWKLHVSGTVLTACDTLERVGPLLNRLDVQFKAPALLANVGRINAGIHESYSQIGKLVTAYPRNNEEAVSVARELYRLTCDLRAPAIPFEERFGPAGCVYYRYGAFRRLNDEKIFIDNPASLLRHPQGYLVPDDRFSVDPPSWVTSPFPKQANPTTETNKSPLTTTYHVFRALTQRGRGGVYQAVDSSASSPRLCVVKEGRVLGEQAWDGRDGRWRVKHEGRVIASLRKSGVEAPEIYSTFHLDDNYYLVTEFINGANLMELLLKRRRRLPVVRALRLAAEIATTVARIHSAGWVWRDCKPGNFIVTRDGKLRPVDFEGACRAGKPDRTRWGTPGFVPSDWRPAAKSREFEDLYAIGASLYLLLTGRLPAPEAIPIQRLRPNVPEEVCRLAAKLLSNKRQKLSAASVAKTLLRTARDHHIANQMVASPEDLRNGRGRQTLGQIAGGRKRVQHGS
jgi:hypothetical protein